MIVTTNNKVVTIERKTLPSKIGERKSPTIRTAAVFMAEIGFEAVEINQLGTVDSSNEILHPFLAIKASATKRRSNGIAEIDIDEFYDSLLLGFFGNIESMVTGLMAAPRLGLGIVPIYTEQMPYKPDMPGHPDYVGHN